jgi:hypothetical protein
VTPVQVRRADVAAILDGTLNRDQALWQLGRELLGHTNHMLDIRNGETAHGHELGCRSAGDDTSLWHHHTKGVWIGRVVRRAPRTPEEQRVAEALVEHGDPPEIPDTEVVWRTRWTPIVALVKPILADASDPRWAHLVAEVIDAAHERRTEVESWPPPWLSSKPRGQRWWAIERRCYAAAAAVWDAARPDQETLW